MGAIWHQALAGLSREMNLLPGQLLRTLTWVRGMELADHKTVTRSTGLDVCFADPRSPWHRGTKENTNRLLRQCFPKGASMKDLTQEDFNRVACTTEFTAQENAEFRYSSRVARVTVALTC